MVFDFDAAVGAPFRTQPGLRRVAAGCPQFTPLAPGSRHQREKLAVLSAFWTQALLAVPGFDATPALAALVRHAAIEHPDAWGWNGESAEARRLGTAVHGDGRIEQTAPGRFGLGDEVARCLHGLPPAWRLAGLLSLAFAEDFVVVDGRDATMAWLAVALPSHWAPEQKVGRHFGEIHVPVADSEWLRGDGEALMRLLAGLPVTRADITGMDVLHRDLLLAAHDIELAQALGRCRTGIVDGVARAHTAAIDTEVGHLADVGISRCLEDKS